MFDLKLLPKLLLIVVLLGTALLFVLLRKDNSKPNSPITYPTVSPSTQVTQTDKPQIVSTKPDLSSDTIVSGSEIIEITFNRPLENVGEFKVRIEPKTEYQVELSGDRKTAKIIPLKPYHLGTSYTLFIGPDSKFDGAGEWRESKDFHFRTIKYTGV